MNMIWCYNFFAVGRVKCFTWIEVGFSVGLVIQLQAVDEFFVLYNSKCLQHLDFRASLLLHKAQGHRCTGETPVAESVLL